MYFLVSTLRCFEGHEGVEHHLTFYFLAMVLVWNAAVVSIAMVWRVRVVQGGLARWPGFPLRDCRWLFLGLSMS